MWFPLLLEAKEPDGGMWTLTRRDGGLGRERPFWLSTALPLTGSSSMLHDSSPELLVDQSVVPGDGSEEKIPHLSDASNFSLFQAGLS